MSFTTFRENNLPVIYIPRKEKRPDFNEWQRFCDELPAESLVEQWERKAAVLGANYGLCLGKASGIVAIDIDTDDKRILDACPPSPVRKKGRIGETRFFKWNEKIQSKPYHECKIDLLANGRQTILPPSLHPEGMPYTWLTPDTLETVKAEELPELDPSFIDNVPKLFSNTYVNNTCIKEERGRNNHLVKVVTHMFTRGEDIEKIIEEVYQEDLKHEVPLFTDESEGMRGDGRKNAEKFVNSNIKSLKRSGVKPVEIEKLMEHEIKIDINKNESIKYPEPRGMMSLFVEWCSCTSKGNQDALGLGGALSLMSVLCANKFISKIGTHTVTPNLYTINLGDSGFGKETSQKLISDLLQHTDLLGSASYRSGTSLVQTLPKQQERIDLIDECSSLLKAMTSDKNHYQSEIVEILSSLFSKASTQFIGLSSATNGSNQGACYNPCITFFGSTTPAGFKSSVNRDMAYKGLMPRFLVFYQKEIGKYKRQDNEKALKIFNELQQYVDELTSIKKIEIKRDDHFKANWGNKYKPKVIPFTSEAEDIYFQFEKDNFNAAANDPSNFESAFINRFSELSAKIALLDTISLSKYKIDSDSIEWAKKVVLSQWESIKSIYEVTSAENQTERDYNKVLNIIREKVIITKTDLVAKTRSLKKQVRNEIIDSLIENEIVFNKEIDCGNGKKKKCYSSLPTVKEQNTRTVSLS